MKFKRIRKLHFVGIGGAGMSGIAEILHNSGYEITGSDLKASDTTAHLKDLGITIYLSHNPENIAGSDVVVTSSAVTDDNPEVIEAHSRKIPVIKRAEMLSELMRMKFSIAVAGTHGKTTTSSLIGYVLTKGGLDPTVIVGGRVLEPGSNAYLGKSDYLVAEADEFDRSIARFSPNIAVITSLEPEHMECYVDYSDLEDCFVDFANRVPFYGSVILCLDDPGVARLQQYVKRPVLSYGISRDRNFGADDIEFDERGTTFSLFHEGNYLTRVSSRLYGKHNVRNLLAAITVAYDLEVPLETIIPEIANFTGVNRRMEFAGEAGGVAFYDDYGHHPTEIKTTIEGLKAAFDGRVVAVFQPHLYSRTKRFYKEFGESFSDADKVVVLDVYPAREKPLNGVSGEMIVKAARESGHRDITFLKDKEELPSHMKRILKKGDRVILFGAGDIVKYTPRIIADIKE
ncbi:MAG: UDP-N-acetylmuramate--L-alanine ligase [Candidatus Zixiibacteriota bacterium]|nr:MAG: UDP-N-acetylmuramate--L-alanine ligase [candidate division Zixibacteria bacterium]